MRVSLAISFFAHLSAIAWASFAFPVATPYEVEPMKAFPVDIISPSELTRLKAGVKGAKEDKVPPPSKTGDGKPDRTGEAKKQKQIAALPPPPPPQPEAPKAATPAPIAARPQPRAPERKSAPEPEPAPEPAPAKVEPTPEREDISDKVVEQKAVPLPSLRPRHVPRPPPPKKKERRFDEDNIAALLNKIPADAEAQSARASTDVPNEQPGAGDLRGIDSLMSLSELDALREQIRPCWNPPVGVQGAADLAVQLRLALNLEGTLTRPPEILTRGSGPAFLAAADAARRAVLRCQPYDLPATKYDTWRDIKVNFDPREMLGG